MWIYFTYLSQLTTIFLLIDRLYYIIIIMKHIFVECVCLFWQGLDIVVYISYCDLNITFYAPCSAQCISILWIIKLWLLLFTWNWTACLVGIDIMIPANTQFECFSHGSCLWVDSQQRQQNFQSNMSIKTEVRLHFYYMLSLLYLINYKGVKPVEMH